MDSTNGMHANLPARLPSGSSRLPAQVTVTPRELAVATPPSIVNSRLLWRGLVRNWWRILILWLVLALPLTYLIYRKVEPTYLAYGIVKLESTQQELYGSSMSPFAPSQPAYLQTEIESMRSDPVLRLALTDPKISDLPTLKESKDPKSDLRKNLDIHIMGSTHFIRVAFESKAPDEARDIVNAVIRAYSATTTDTEGKTTSSKFFVQKNLNEKNANAFRLKAEELKTSIEKHRSEILSKTSKGDVDLEWQKNTPSKDDADQSPSLVFNPKSLEQFKSTETLLLQTQYQIIDLEARLKVRLEDEQRAQENGRNALAQGNEEIRERIVQEFRRDPEVAAVIAQIKSTTQEVEHLRGMVRRPDDPSRVAAQLMLTNLNKDYNDLWRVKSEQIRQRLLVTTSATNAPDLESAAELKHKLEELRQKQLKYTELMNKFKIVKQNSQEAAVRASFERDELLRDYSRYDLVDRRLEQLEFTKDKPGVEIERIDEAELPVVPNNNKRLKYMAIVPVAILFGLLGLFLLLEVRSERVGDPDSLSSRVQSEVYALPPLPTSRAAQTQRARDGRPDRPVHPAAGPPAVRNLRRPARLGARTLRAGYQRHWWGRQNHLGGATCRQMRQCGHLDPAGRRRHAAIGALPAARRSRGPGPQ